MISLLDCYRILGVSANAGIAEIISAYRKLCRIHHPDISDNPNSEELMKDINAAYSMLRDRYRNESAFRDRQAYPRSARRYPGAATRASSSRHDKEAYAVLYDYFRALSACEYSEAYNYLCDYDKRQITKESFVEWRESVARLYHIKEFFISANAVGTTVVFSDGKQIFASKFHVAVNEDDQVENTARSSEVEKLMVNENGAWKVFLGYKGVRDLTRTFDERFEAGRRRDFARRWEEYYSGQHPDFDMLSLAGMRKAAARELYRQSRFGGTLTFAVISVNDGGKHGSGPAGGDSKGAARENGRGSPNGAHSSEPSNTQSRAQSSAQAARENVHSSRDGNRANGDSGRGARENGQLEQLLRSAARTICGALRETDIPAYAGDGVFMILFIELRRKDSEEIIVRLTKKIRGNAGTRLGLQAEIDYAYGSWHGNASASIDAFNDVLKKFDKKL